MLSHQENRVFELKFFHLRKILDSLDVMQLDSYLPIGYRCIVLRQADNAIQQHHLLSEDILVSSNKTGILLPTQIFLAIPEG
ncbi:hypothetical protein KR51_00037380 [Rubidibacter lacunae KORDI 51-2]|uniref:Uncharacterized protein n=1 Tax=Rubidibacter lacunae KORDI 51-2 TaxID=582515 RepID=U5DEU7_9CHRO|nr:hypothetical protein KR51_00037380 [Rubidibacter lacunae KORDI 51-2]